MHHRDQILSDKEAGDDFGGTVYRAFTDSFPELDYLPMWEAAVFLIIWLYTRHANSEAFAPQKYKKAQKGDRFGYDQYLGPGPYRRATIAMDIDDHFRDGEVEVAIRKIITFTPAYRRRYLIPLVEYYLTESNDVDRRFAAAFATVDIAIQNENRLSPAWVRAALENAVRLFILDVVGNGDGRGYRLRAIVDDVTECFSLMLRSPDAALVPVIVGSLEWIREQAKQGAVDLDLSPDLLEI